MDRREYKQMMDQIRPAPELMERVLAEGQTERSRPMKHRIRAAGVAALAAALLMGTALAVNSGFLERYFKGDLSVVEPYIQGGESVSDGKFRLTLDSAVVDQYGLVAQVTLEALTDEGAAWLMEGAQMSPWERYDAPESTFDPGDVWLASADYAGEQLSWRYCNASPKLEGEHSYQLLGRHQPAHRPERDHPAPGGIRPQRDGGGTGHPVDRGGLHGTRSMPSVCRRWAPWAP